MNTDEHRYVDHRIFICVYLCSSVVKTVFLVFLVTWWFNRSSPRSSALLSVSAVNDFKATGFTFVRPAVLRAATGRIRGSAHQGPGRKSGGRRRADPTGPGR